MPNFEFPRQSFFYRGKVRDVYGIDENLLVMITSDRISAFDVVLPHPIPYKGQVLNQVAAYMLNASKDICPNWLLDVPAPNASIGLKCKPFKLEMVVRGHLVGHAWREYSAGRRKICGVVMPEGLNAFDPFPQPIITPSTKADAGHDEDISATELISQGIISATQWEQLQSYALRLFERGKELATMRGLILADTKYEFGLFNDEIMLMDEIHTPDSSRYFYLDGFEERQANGEKQQQLSKEFVREWLIQNNFMGKEGQTVPEMSTEWITQISAKYIELYERMVGETFIPQQLPEEETYKKIIDALHHLSASTMVP